MGGDEDGGNLALGLYFAFWFLGNNFYNIQNKRALNATGGKHAGFGMTVATLQLGVGTLYSFLIWIIGYNFLPIVGFVKPTKQSPPKMSMGDMMKMIPVAFCSAAAHSSSVLALNAGSVTFGQIVKAAEPVFSAVVATVMYGKKISLIKWLTLPVIVGGVVFSSFKPLPTCVPKGPPKCVAAGSMFPYEVEVDMTALIMASIANLFAAIKGNENSKLMTSDPELKKRIGGVGNQFAMTEVLGFFISLPLMFYLEGGQFMKFTEMVTTDSVLSYNLIASGMTFYLYNELATMTIKKTSAVTASVANTAKRVIVMVVSAIVFGEVMTFEAKVGATVGRQDPREGPARDAPPAGSSLPFRPSPSLPFSFPSFRFPSLPTFSLARPTPAHWRTPPACRCPACARSPSARSHALHLAPISLRARSELAPVPRQAPSALCPLPSACAAILGVFLNSTLEDLLFPKKADAAKKAK